VAKLIEAEAFGESAGQQKDRRSYSTEASFFQCGHAEWLLAKGVACPRPVLVEQGDDGSLLQGDDSSARG